MNALGSFFRERFKKAQPLVVGKPVAPRVPVDTATPTAQVIALRPAPEPSVAEPVQVPELVTSLTHIPLDAPVLTANVGKPLFPIDRGLEGALMLLETAPRRVQLYFDPASRAEGLHEAIVELRRRLMIQHYEVDGPDRPCTAEIIATLVENHKKRSQQYGENSSDSAARKLFESWIDVAWRARASDLHIDLTNGQGLASVRVDGELIPLPNENQGRHTISQAESALSWAWGEYTQDSSNNTSHWSASQRVHAYAMFKPRQIDNALVSMRFQSMTGAFGPKAVMRLADQAAATLSFSELGLERSHQELLRSAAKATAGLVLLTGVTGSGKTTLMKTYLETHPLNREGAIQTLEEPVELPIKGTHQTSVQRDLANPTKSRQQYRELIASTLRMDPDGILVGEIRDDVTASAVQQIVDTGHFVVSTLHSRYLSGIAGRLAQADIGYSRELFTAPNVINLLSYQALVPLVCPKCRVLATDESEFKEIHFGNEASVSLETNIDNIYRTLDILDKKFGLDVSRFVFRRACGCDRCRTSGTIGRTAVAEMIQPDRNWLELTRKGDDQGAIDYYRSFSNDDYYSDDMNGKTIFEHALYKSLNGWIDVRQCEAFGAFDKYEVLSK